MLFKSKSSCISLSAGAMAVVAGLVGGSSGGSARANVIYQDTFYRSGNPQTLLGSVPTTDNGPVPGSDSWGGYTNLGQDWTTSGTSPATGVLTMSTNSGGGYLNAWLPLNNIAAPMILSATMAITTSSSQCDLGFESTNGSTSPIWNQSGGVDPWVSLGTGSVLFFEGGTEIASVSSSSGTPVALAIEIAPVVGGTTVTFFVNSVNEGSYNTNTALPLNYVALVQKTSLSSNMNATVQNLELQTVPEPAALGLMAAGGLGMLMIKRRRTA